MSRHAVVLIGSPRPPSQSTSESLARYLVERLSEAGIETSVFRAIHVYRRHGVFEMLQKLDRAEMLVVASPLYVDSLPYPVIRTFERIALHREQTPDTQPAQMLAIINCGFPEAEHTHIALAICRLFARQAGFTWSGGLGLGGGEAIGGRKLEEVGWLARNVCPAIDLAAKALIDHTAVPQEAVDLIESPVVHPRLYTLMATVGWYRRAWENGVLRQLRATPFLRHP